MARAARRARRLAQAHGQRPRALLYDFGPGPYALPLTVVEFGLRDQALTRTRQWAESPRAPIIRTTLAAEFLEALQRSSQRDMRSDAHGNRYLPVRVGLTGRDEVPQVAQWGEFEHHLFGEGLPLESELLRGKLLLHTRSLAAAGFRLEGQAAAPHTMTVTPGQAATLHFAR